MSLIGDGVEFEGFGFEEDNFLCFGLCEVAVDCFDDGGGGVEREVVELHI